MKIIVDVSLEAYAEMKNTHGFKTYLEHVISQGVPLDAVFREIDYQIATENKSLFADFKNYAVSCLGVNEDNVPDDFFYFVFGKEKEIIQKCISRYLMEAVNDKA